MEYITPHAPKFKFYCPPKVTFSIDNDSVTITFEEFRQMIALIAKHEELETRFTQMEREFAAIKEHLSKRSMEMAEFVNSVNAPVKNVGHGK